MNGATPDSPAQTVTPLARRGAALRTALAQAWGQRSPREQFLLSLVLVSLTLLGLWRTAVAPAWRTWQEAPARQARLDKQSQQMQELQAQAKNLQMTQALSRADALVWLEKNLTELGPEARIKLQDERATLSVSAAEPEALARWLSDARERAQALPVQGQLKQTSTPVVALAGKGKIGSPTMPSGADESVSSGARAPILWQGTLVLRLP